MELAIVIIRGGQKASPFLNCIIKTKIPLGPGLNGSQIRNNGPGLNGTYRTVLAQTKRRCKTWLSRSAAFSPSMSHGVTFYFVQLGHFSKRVFYFWEWISRTWRNIFTNGLFQTNRTPKDSAFCEGFLITLPELGEPSILHMKPVIWEREWRRGFSDFFYAVSSGIVRFPSKLRSRQL